MIRYQNRLLRRIKDKRCQRREKMNWARFLLSLEGDKGRSKGQHFTYIRSIKQLCKGITVPNLQVKKTEAQGS